MRKRTIVAELAIAGAVIAGLVGGSQLVPRDAASAEPKPAASPRVTLGDEKHPGDIGPLKACLTEDDTDCYWDAEKRGNHKGQSFTVTKDGQVRYWVMPLSQWRANLKAEGFTRMAGDPVGHGECWAIAPDGDTAVLVCRDGYAAVS